MMEFFLTNSTTHFKLDREVNLEEAILFGGGLITHSKKVIRGNKCLGFDSVNFRVPLSSRRTATAIIHRTGSVILVGAKTFEDIKEASFNVSIWFQSGIKNARISNLCATLNVNRYINLYKLEKFIKENPEENTSSFYEPELFPGISYRYTGFGTKCHCTIYSTGKIMITGVKNVGQLEFTKDKLLCLLTNFGLNKVQF